MRILIETIGLNGFMVELLRGVLKDGWKSTTLPRNEVTVVGQKQKGKTLIRPTAIVDEPTEMSIIKVYYKNDDDRVIFRDEIGRICRAFLRDCKCEVIYVRFVPQR